MGKNRGCLDWEEMKLEASNNGDVPIVSVVIPCYNAGVLLDDAIESVLSQKGPFDLTEVLVVDDNSTDEDTRDVLKRIQDIPKVRVITNSRKKGPAGARNTGAFAAAAQWLAFLDADDIWLEDSLALRFQAMEAFPDARFITGDFQIQYMDTGMVEENFFRSRPRTSQFYGPAYSSGLPIRLSKPYLTALQTVLCHSCSVLIDRSLFVSVGGFEESLLYKEDHHLWFKIAKETDFILVPHSLFFYRQYGTNMTHAETPPFEYERLMLDMVRETEDLKALLSDYRTRYSLGHSANAAYFRAHGDFADAFYEALKGIRYGPLRLAGWRQLLAAGFRIR